MEKMDYWRLCEDLTVIQAALLIVEADPELYGYVLNLETKERPANFNATFTVLSQAIIGGRLAATKRMITDNRWCNTAEEMIEYETDDPDWNKTTIDVDDLKIWLKNRGIKPRFFFPQDVDTPDFLDSQHCNFSPKLAAAICAWQAVNADDNLIKGTTVKQALLKWLRKNADKFGLTKDDGNPNEQGIEEIAKIANWDTKGGAPKTPS